MHRPRSGGARLELGGDQAEDGDDHAATNTAPDLDDGSLKGSDLGMKLSNVVVDAVKTLIHPAG